MIDIEIIVLIFILLLLFIKYRAKKKEMPNSVSGGGALEVQLFTAPTLPPSHLF